MANHDFNIENNPGRAVRTDFNNALAALATNNSGDIEPGVLYPGMLWLDLSVLPDGLMRQRNQANTGWIALSGMPDKASEAEVVAGTDDSKYVTPARAKERYDVVPPIVPNLLVNPAMQVSQENADNLIGHSGGAAMYVADCWLSNGASPATWDVLHYAVATPRGSPYRLWGRATVAKPALATGDIAAFYQNIEGIRIASLLWGTASAKPVVVRFGFRGPAGTYALAIRNAAGTRSFVRSFVIIAAFANVDTEQVFVIPGETTGAWPVDNTRAMVLSITVACGATYQVAAGTWQNGDFRGAAGMSNGLATAGNVFNVFDVGLYEDVSGQGTPPQWRFPDHVDNLRDCQRYYCLTSTIWSGDTYASGFTYYSIIGMLPVNMRASQSFSGGAQAVGSFGGPTYAINTSAFYRGVYEARTSNATANGYFHTNGLVANARV